MSTTTKRLSLALAASLALNVFFAGFLTARALSGPRDRGEGRGPHGLFLGPRGLLGASGAEQEVSRVMERHGPRLQASRRGLRGTRRAVRDALAAEPFERQALEQALSSMRARTAESQAAMHAALVDLADQLPREQRRKLGGKLRRSGH
jgi:Spy/CpxP family protein refolding chaperone